MQMNDPIRRLQVVHTTRYSYDRPITRSSHRLHLRPITDRRQRVLDFDLKITPDAPLIEYDDVFGNVSARFELRQPYQELAFTSRSLVELVDEDPFAFASVPIRPSFPLVWMPWERLMLNPYLQPVELPDTQLQEISQYAMGFVERNDHDLMETLFAINLAMNREFTYVPRCTTVRTTPYDVLISRKGVCQDFTNLFACMARLLGIPARYCCGYLYTGEKEQDSVANNSSHAWAELYIPHFGWKGFDPTNGTLPHLDHVRLAYGRHYFDATPTSGAHYSPEAFETMSVNVEVRDVTKLAVPVNARRDETPESVAGDKLEAVAVTA